MYDALHTVASVLLNVGTEGFWDFPKPAFRGASPAVPEIPSGPPLGSSASDSPTGVAYYKPIYEGGVDGPAVLWSP